jgi:outer membrane protein assembly factor BamE (lipoprotein component of BamABCDE complex)
MNKIQSLIAIALLAACSPKVDTGGYIVENDLKSQLVRGQTTKEEIQQKFGSPSSQSSFGPDTWYYITTRKEAVGFLKPEVVQQDVLRIEFDQAGVVNSVQSYDKNDARQFSMTKRTTPTEGHRMGFVEQVVGNIGRFNAPAGNGSIVPGRRPGGGGGRY